VRIIPQEAIIAAWADVKAAEFAKEVQGGALPNHRSGIKDVGLCRLGSSRGTSWVARGDTTLDLVELTITRFEGLVTQAATFSDSTSASLPIGFSALEVKGRYVIQSHCVLVGAFGMEMSKQDQRASGTLTENFAASSLIYKAKLGNSLSLTGVQIPGKASVDVKSDSTLQAWLQTFASVMSGNDMQTAILDRLVKVFETTFFAAAMIAKLNKQLGV
jgi:hypothetical protein